MGERPRARGKTTPSAKEATVLFLGFSRFQPRRTAVAPRHARVAVGQTREPVGYLALSFTAVLASFSCLR